MTKIWNIPSDGRESRPTDNTTIKEILPSYYWPQHAVVIVTACNHRHVRPIRDDIQIGDLFLCPFCLDENESAERGA